MKFGYQAGERITEMSQTYTRASLVARAAGQLTVALVTQMQRPVAGTEHGPQDQETSADPLSHCAEYIKTSKSPHGNNKLGSVFVNTQTNLSVIIITPGKMF